mmetsp:Transcript_3228/g.9360  ORF Transcript_3228/g.9360 Transcript_3228/m.9360 type:complete len:276 (-) Transcript_3228:848-1675(-)
MPENTGPGDAAPIAMMPARPAAVVTARLRASARVSTTLGSTFTSALGLAAAVGPARGGGGHMSSPLCVTRAPRTASSLRSTLKTPFSLLRKGPIDSRNLVMLFDSRVDDCVGKRLGRSLYPMQVTPFGVSMTSSFTVVAMLPPFCAARSTVTLPGFMEAIISLLMSKGAFLPGMSAVVMMMSTSLHCFANRSISAAMNSGDISLAYPPPPSPDSSSSTVRNSAPSDLACSATAARVSKTRTMAPMFLAVPIALRPATPPPMTSTLAGGILPAAVI